MSAACNKMPQTLNHRHNNNIHIISIGGDRQINPPFIARLTNLGIPQKKNQKSSLAIHIYR